MISCKTTCRERWTQDEWTLQWIPKLYILLTFANDYPPSKRFKEGPTRKIITCLPKKREDRIFPLSYDNLYTEISNVLNTA